MTYVSYKTATASAGWSLWAPFRAGFDPRLLRLTQQLALGAVVPLAVLLLWHTATKGEWLAPQVLPAPGLVWETTGELLASGELQSELWVSLQRVLWGVALGGALGLIAGLAFGLSRFLDIYVAPTIRAICLVPSLGWLPFFMLLFGIGEALKIILIAKTCFLPLMVSAYEGLRNRPRKYDEIAAALELPFLTRVFQITLPSILPSVLTGLRLALSKGWKALILVEMISSAAGIGYLMMWGRKAFQLDVVFATIIVIGVVGWFMDAALLRLQNRLTGWSVKSVG
ncbi:ABC transporter permease [Paracoccus aminophilus]|uniref:ABC-type nitrate/sulfonate/bicarbonate transport system, permease component n=1 Tax=Paracoccus aminophilus JCM 7686 TaxID=1367847 RepID=S5XV13_PARAH|nr:ABC transporter permease [Paracoccus aminophilus]AGT11364.1 ABC-type nitrate/sulfonate/bicarbonate transport system, permease component [Paracoccus aminophilus JCM 7686]